jgi:hypothetical protein
MFNIKVEQPKNSLEFFEIFSEAEWAKSSLELFEFASHFQKIYVAQEQRPAAIPFKAQLVQDFFSVFSFRNSLAERFP